MFLFAFVFALFYNFPTNTTHLEESYAYKKENFSKIMHKKCELFKYCVINQSAFNNNETCRFIVHLIKKEYYKYKALKIKFFDIKYQAHKNNNKVFINAMLKYISIESKIQNAFLLKLEDFLHSFDRKSIKILKERIDFTKLNRLIFGTKSLEEN